MGSRYDWDILFWGLPHPVRKAVVPFPGWRVRVVEQLIHYFYARGSLTRTELEDLIERGFIRPEDVPNYDFSVLEPTPLYEPEPTERGYDHHDEPPRRRSGGGGSKKSNKNKPKPTGHNLAPLESFLGSFIADRIPLTGLVELGHLLDSRVNSWEQALGVVAGSTPEKLQSALVRLLNARPTILGELWFWYHIEPVYAWAEARDNLGPVAAAVGGLLRANVLTEVGRLNKLKQGQHVGALIHLIAGRRILLRALHNLYTHHFPRLKFWLVRPSGLPGQVWPGLPWAYVMLYSSATPATGYTVLPRVLGAEHLKLAWETALTMDYQAALRHINIEAELDTDVTVLLDRWDEFCTKTLTCPIDWSIVH